MKAEEAKRITVQEQEEYNAGELSRVLSSIQRAAQEKRFQCYVPSMFEKTRDEIMNLGYEVLNDSGPERERISWKEVKASNISLAEYLQESCGATYPLEDIFNNLEPEQIIKTIQQYIKENSAEGLVGTVIEYVTDANWDVKGNWDIVQSVTKDNKLQLSNMVISVEGFEENIRTGRYKAITKII